MDLLEGVVRVPLVERRAARIEAGSVSRMPNLTMDWTASMLAPAGVSAGDDYPLDGVDLAPHFASEDPSG